MKPSKLVVTAAFAALLAIGLLACSSSAGENVDAPDEAAEATSTAEPAAEGNDTADVAATPEVIEYEFYSVATPEGWHKSEDSSHAFTTEDLQKSLSVHVYPDTASEMLEYELSDPDYVALDDYTAGGKTYLVAYSERWEDAYYIMDWEDGCFEVHATYLTDSAEDQAALQTFLGTLQPAEDAYAKWQAID